MHNNYSSQHFRSTTRVYASLLSFSLQSPLSFRVWLLSLLHGMLLHLCDILHQLLLTIIYGEHIFYPPPPLTTHTPTLSLVYSCMFPNS